VGTNLAPQYAYMLHNYSRCTTHTVEIDTVFGLIQTSYADLYVLKQVGDTWDRTLQSNVDLVMASLVQLHINGVVHGDAQFQNVLLFDGVFKWFDFAPLAHNLSIAQDLRMFLVDMIPALRLFFEYSSAKVCAYCENPSVELLKEVYLYFVEVVYVRTHEGGNISS
jgi:hypothetical protein